MKAKNKTDYIIKMKKRKEYKDTPKELERHHKSYKVRTIKKVVIPNVPYRYKRNRSNRVLNELFNDQLKDNPGNTRSNYNHFKEKLNG